MPDQWVNFFREMQDSTISIFMDQQYAAPIQKFPNLVTVSLTMTSPRPDGLSSGEEFPRLCEVEEALEKVPGKYVGRQTGQGKRSFYFYVPGNEQSWPANVLGQFQDYQFDVTRQLDPSWSKYYEVLVPDPEEMETIKNSRVLEILETHCDDSSVPRAVRHWIYFRSVADREQFFQEFFAEGYEKEYEADSPEYDEDCHFCLCIKTTTKVDQESMDKSVIELFRVAETYDAIYDGWETEIVSKQN